MPKAKQTKRSKRINKTQKEGTLIPFPKRVYLCWYLFIQDCDDKKGVYKDWNVKKSEKFDLWWDKNWKGLFSEPIKRVEKITKLPNVQPDKDSIFVKVPINKTSGDLVSEFEEVIREEFKERGINRQKVFESKGTWIPSVTHQFDYSTCRLNLKCLQLQKKGLTREEIATKCKIHQGGDKHTRVRMVSRYVQNANKTMEWVKKGQFK